ncbi:hypothetical protein OOK31_38425 [Streptomyces sp. NBC_00249]|uniref:hypothetical protein n=1 Tax=Streptomyces sp. NBC_00249 TaxID=2975690 RepID=UPI00225139CA|nr:hypothetical protein [Streptomyces sp. NBC_00249]MCX5199688.1 hypothetical protein [Streptomyces sp. NBC_00249]
MTPRLLLARLAATVAALVLLSGLAAPAALARPAAVPATAPQAPTVDWWGIGKCANWLLPNVPSLPGGSSAVDCAKIALKGKKAIDQVPGQVMSAAAQKVSDSVIGDAAKTMAEFVDGFVRIGFSYWLMTPSVQVKDSGVLGDTASDDPTKKLSLHGLMMGVGAGIATLLVMLQGIKTVIQRKGTPLAHLLQGFMVNLLVSAAGIAIIDALLIASDQLTKQILFVGFGGENVPDRMAVMLLPPLENSLGLFAISVSALIIGGIQIVMLFLRQAAIPIQALILPIAGAGQLGGESTRQWLPRTFTAIMVIIVYKPIAALIIAVGFTEIANGNGTIDFIRGCVTLTLSVFALKSLFALFAPIGATMGSAVSAGGGLGGALGMLGSALGSHLSKGGESGPTSATKHAADMERNGPAGGGGGNGGGGGGGGGGNGGDPTGSNAIKQSSIPQQGGGPEAQAAQTATGNATNAGAPASKAAPAVAIAMVAAEAGQAAINKASGAAGGTE